MSIEERAKKYGSGYSPLTPFLSKITRKAYIQGAEDQKEIMWSDFEAFHQWLSDNRWFTFSDGKWNYTFEHGTSISKVSYEKNYRKTTQELYERYNEEMNVFTVKTVERETSVPKEQIKKAVEEVYKTKKK